jgi:hypothetical protein
MKLKWIGNQHNISEEENLSSVREGTDEEGETISTSEYVKQLWTWTGMGSEMRGGISWTSSKGEGGSDLPKSIAKDTEIINIDDLLAPGAGAPIRGVSKLWKALSYTKEVLGGLDNGKKIREAIEKATAGDDDWEPPTTISENLISRCDSLIFNEKDSTISNISKVTTYTVEFDDSTDVTIPPKETKDAKQITY